MPHDDEEHIPAPALPPHVQEAFADIARRQRGKPESAMNNIQKLGGGVLSYAVEHAGDLSHRMNEGFEPRRSWGPGYPRNKVDRVLETLTHPFGFEREHHQNVANNARFLNVPEDELHRQYDEALANYAHEHSQLPAYNRPQWLARETAVSLGHKKWPHAVRHLSELQKLMDNKPEYHRALSSFQLDDKGNIMPYVPPPTGNIMNREAAGLLKLLDMINFAQLQKYPQVTISFRSRMLYKGLAQYGVNAGKSKTIYAAAVT